MLNGIIKTRGGTEEEGEEGDGKKRIKKRLTRTKKMKRKIEMTKRRLWRESRKRRRGSKHIMRK